MIRFQLVARMVAPVVLAYLAGSWLRPEETPPVQGGGPVSEHSRKRSGVSESASSSRSIVDAGLLDWSRLERVARMSHREILSELEKSLNNTGGDWDPQFLAKRAVEMEGRASVLWAAERFGNEDWKVRMLAGFWSSLDPSGSAGTLIPLLSNSTGNVRSTQHKLEALDWRGFASKDPKRALETYLGLKSGDRGGGTVSRLVAGLMDANPEQAFELLESGIEGIDFGRLSPEEWQAIAEAEPERLLAWARARDQGADDALLAGVALARAESGDVSAAFESIAELSADRIQSALGGAAFRMASAGRGEEALMLLDRFATPAKQAELLGNFVDNWFSIDSSAACEAILERPELLPLAGPRQVVSGFEIADRANELAGLAGSAGDPEIRLALQAALIDAGHESPDPGMFDSVGATKHLAKPLGNILTHDPDAGLAVWDGLSDEVKNRHANDPGTVMELKRAFDDLPGDLLLELADGSSGTLAAVLREQSIKQFAKSDFNEAAGRINDLPPGSLPDRVTCEFVDEWSYEDPAAAAAWLEQSGR